MESIQIVKIRIIYNIRGILTTVKKAIKIIYWIQKIERICKVRLIPMGSLVFMKLIQLVENKKDTPFTS